jgi:hypothetical protein
MRLLNEPNGKDSRSSVRDPRTQNRFTRQTRLRGSIIAFVIGLLVLPFCLAARRQPARTLIRLPCRRS